MDNVKYAAEISPVEEVVLVGRADRTFWQQRLAEHGLRPRAENADVEIALTAVEGKFKGMQFRELSISVAANGPQGEGFFLTHAF